MNNRLLSTIAVAVLGLATAPSASAADFYDLLRGYLGVSAPNNKVAANQALIISNMNTREAQLQNDISSGVTTGQLTAAEQNDLRADLNRISNLKAQYMADGSFNNFEVQSMLNEMMAFSTRLNTSLTNNVTTANSGFGNSWFNRNIGWGNSNNAFGNQAMLQANLSTRKSQLAASIDDGIRRGRLSWSEARMLRDRLDQISSKQSGFNGNDNRLSFRESRELINDLNNLETRIRAESNDGERTGGWRGRSFADRGYRYY